MLLALETASETGGVALLDGETVLAERIVGARTPHYAAELLVSLDAMLAELGRAERDIEALALSVGPGSFTGLRIGLATALGLAFGTERRIVPVPTLAALALGAAPGRAIVPMLDARKGQVYAGVYDDAGRPREVDRVVAPLALLRELAGRGDRAELVFLGPGARLYANEIWTVLGGAAEILPAARGEPRPERVGRLGARIRAAGGALEPHRVELRYLRPSQAEEGGAAAGHASGKRIS